MKLTPKDKEIIYEAFHLLGETNITRLAQTYSVSRSMIRFIVYPDKLRRNRELQKVRRQRGKV